MKTTTRIFLPVFMMFFFSCSILNQGGGEENDWKKKAKIADKMFKEGIYYDAIDYYEEALEGNPGDTKLTFKLAESYNYSRDYRKAEYHYKAVIDSNPKHEHLLQFKYATMLKMNAKYAQAKEEFTQFIKSYRGEHSVSYKKLAKNEILGCEYARVAIDSPLNVKISHLGTNINAAYTESSPFPLSDDELMYASLRSDTVLVAENVIEKGYLFRLYTAKKTSSDTWSEGQTMSDVINFPESNIGNGTISPDGKYLYFTSCLEDAHGEMLCDIYRTKMDSGEWQLPEKLPAAVNMPGHTNTHPTLGTYKKGSQLLYFTSDRPNGQGGKDLWVSVITKDGSFKEARNLGRKINTFADEMTPFYNNQAKTLYFSSMGHPGLGGMDVFFSEGNYRRWSKPDNIGYPLNSRVDDIYYVTDADGGGGFMVSNRPGVIALKSETCCDDIFRFDWVNVLHFAVTGFVYDVEDETKTPMHNSGVKLYIIDEDEGEEVYIDETVTEGKKWFFFTLIQNRNYTLTGSQEGYFSNQVGISTIGLTKSDTIETKIPLKKIVINQTFVLEDIFYDFDRHTLRSESKNTLDSLVMILNNNQEILTELGSHTDSKGNDDYNIKLSQRRAESVVKYLIAAGIETSRLTAMGYGETVPIAPNEFSDGSDNPEGRQLNRRTEIKVTGKREVIEDDDEFLDEE